MKIIFLLFALSVSIQQFLTSLAMADQPIDDYQITAKKLDKSRNSLSTTTGTSAYLFDQKAISSTAMGTAGSLNKVLLQAPGVAQDSGGQLHIRGDHGNLQYRINGVIIPQSIGGFGEILDTHFVDNVTLLTGALPANYGYRTAGVVEIKTKMGSFENGGRSEITTGSNQTLGGNQQFYGSSGKFNYYLSASYLQNDLGIESPTAGKNSLHNFTKQDKQFGYFSYLINNTSRFSLILGNATNRFQIPNNPNQQASFDVNGVDKNSFSSALLDENQNQGNKYAIASLQGTWQNGVDYQIALFSRFSNLNLKPDYAGDLAFNGVASKVNNSSQTNGIQADFSYPINEYHNLRSGFFVSNDQEKSNRNTSVFEANDDGTAKNDIPFAIADLTKKHSQLYSLYLQDEWKAIDKLTINYGLRFDSSQSYVDASQLSPRLGAIYALNSETKFHLGYSKYFTTPPSEMISPSKLTDFNGTTNASENTTNNQVKPERTDYYDIGINHKLTKNITIGLDGYYKNIKDFLDEEQFGSALIYIPFNYQKAKIYGTELTINYNQDNFSSYLNLAWSDAKARNIVSSQYLFGEDELNYIASHYVRPDHDQIYTASAGATYKFKQVNYSLDAIYGNGLRKGFANSSKMPSYTQVNLGVNRDFKLPIINQFNARLSVINLFDEVYQLHDGTGIGYSAPQYGSRRGYYLTISKNF